MKNQICFLLALMLFLSISLNAQLPDGSLSPNFSLPDMNLSMTNHDLYSDYLNNNKHVVLDFSATWCGPCWNYHQTGAIEDFYADNGPLGTDVAMAFMLEADEDTNLACLYGQAGCNDTSLGNWVTGVDYPIINAPNSALRTTFSISYWPTIYMVNGYDNRIFEVGQPTASGFENWLESFDLEITNANIIPHNCLSYGSIELETEGGYNSLSYDWSNNSTSDVLEGLTAGDYYVTITDQNGYWIERGPFTVTEDNTNNDFNIEVYDFSNVTCNGYDNGWLEVEATGLNLEYLWSNGSTSPISGALSPGSHSVVVSNDIGCVDSEVYSITEPSELLATFPYTDPTCANNDGSVQIMANGGTSPYYYELDGEQNTSGIYNDLAPGEYSIVVYDNNGCFFVDLVILTGDPVPDAVSSVMDEINCNNDMVEISGNGSSSGSNISYEWFDENMNSIATTLTTEVMAAGTYSLVVTNDLGCSETSTVVVEDDFSTPTISSTSETLTCTSTSVELCMTVSGASESYWIVNGQEVTDNCITVDSPGDYSAVAKGANGCESTSVSTVDVSTDIPEVAISSPEILTCVMTNQIITGDLVGDVADHTISWSTTDGNIVNQVSPLEVEIDAPGVYELSVTNTATGCNVLTTVLVDEFINTPAASFSADNDDDFLYLTGSAVGDPTSWEWSVDGVTVGNTQNYQFSLMGGEQNAEVCLMITNECGSDVICNSVSITDPLEVFVSAINVGCFGESTGSIMISAIGGVAPYTMETVGPNGYSSAMQNLNNLPAGLYIITVNDSETRMRQVTIEITENPLLVASGQSLEPLCFGSVDGKIDLVIEGGSGTYEYNWSNGSTELSLDNIGAGDYSVEITDDAGCVTTLSFTLMDPEAIVQDGVVQDLNCFGDNSGSIVLSASGGTGMLDYQWDDTDLDGLSNSNLAAGTYTLIIEDENGCKSEESYTVNEPEALVYNLESVVDDIDGAGGSIDVTVSGGTTPYTFEWSNGATTEDIDGLSMGEYSLIVTDANGCEVFTDTYEVEFSSNVNEISDLVSFNVFPNPAQDRIQVNLEMNTNKSGKVEILDTAGKLISTNVFTSTNQVNLSVDLLNFSSGIYMLRVRTTDGIAMKKISVLK